MLRPLSVFLAAALISLPSLVIAQSQTSPHTAPAPSPAVAATSRPAAIDLPLTFARSGTKVKADLMLTGWSTFKEDRPDGQPVDHWIAKVVLRAFGRTWTEPALVTAKTWRGPAMGGIEAEISVPSVRVPTAFSIQVDIPVAAPMEVGILIAYPERDIEWDKKITLYSADTPKWFNQWAATVGLPVTSISTNDPASAKLTPPDEKNKCLLILGRSDALKDLPPVTTLAVEKKINILALDAYWTHIDAGAVNVLPSQMLGGLAEIAKQHWPKPLAFSHHRNPWDGIANRWAWLVDERGLPLVEQVLCNFSDSHPQQAIVLNYVFWQQRLGRDESADSTFVALLAAAAKAGPPIVGDYHGVSVTARPSELLVDRIARPELEGTRPFRATPDRPVLSAAISRYGATDMGPRQLDILDIRGNQTLTVEMREFAEKPAVRGWVRQVLILGDDKLLDEWQWLKLNRAKKTIDRPEIVWLSADELPPSNDNQVKLMLKLTELGVPLVPPAKEKGADKP